MTEITHHREVHYWNEDLGEPPCGTLEERFDWSDAVEDVTCELCRDALERGRDRARSDGGTIDQPPA